MNEVMETRQRVCDFNSYKKQLETGWVGEMWSKSSPGGVCVPMEQGDKVTLLLIGPSIFHSSYLIAIYFNEQYIRARYAISYNFKLHYI